MPEWVSLMLKTAVRKFCLNLAKLGAAYWVAHAAHLQSCCPFIHGLTGITIDPESLADFMTAFGFGILHEAHVAVLKKWPALGGIL